MYTFNELFRQSNHEQEASSLSAVSVMRSRADTVADESLEEDRVMIAFFDSQVRRQRRLEELSGESAGHSASGGMTASKRRKLKR